VVDGDDYEDNDEKQTRYSYFGMTMKEAYLIDVRIPNNCNLYIVITKRLQKYTELKEELTKV
jgi:hypothetical protein